MRPDPIKLTTLATSAGCAAKLPQAHLLELIGRLKQTSDSDLLVGDATFDDAGVYRIRPDLALVQTVDFFTPIVDDPYFFGQIAAANALSDVYAMGGRPITAMHLLAIPPDKLPPAAVARILEGGGSKARQAGCNSVGGHTIKTLEPIYGLSVTGTVHPDRILKNANARTGDYLVLTKQLGTGIATTAVKRKLAGPALERKVTALMRRLNTVGADLAEAGLVRAATDVTGFGLLGHLANICRASNVSAAVFADEVRPFSPEIFDLIDQHCVPGGSVANLNSANETTDWGHTPDPLRALMTDAQTSGGLLLCVPPDALTNVLVTLRDARVSSRDVIGRIVPRSEFLVRVVPSGNSGGR